MSKKHFIALADALRGVRPLLPESNAAVIQWARDVDAIADVCARSNPAFKRDRFIRHIYGESSPTPVIFAKREGGEAGTPSTRRSE